MDSDAQHIYPNCPTTTRVVTIGGLTKPELIEELRRNAISMNESAERLFASEHLTTAQSQYSVTTIELIVRELGYPQGATLNEIYGRAQALALALCPLELGPYLRLQYPDQPEGDWGQPIRQNQAPSGAITIASQPLSDDDEFPKGFYLRRIQGTLWLRGYRCSLEHVWNPDDHFIFCHT